jgi:hypothetical protein
MDGSDNGYQKAMCSRESGLRAHNMINHSRFKSQHTWGVI